MQGIIRFESQFVPCVAAFTTGIYSEGEGMTLDRSDAREHFRTVADEQRCSGKILFRRIAVLCVSHAFSLCIFVSECLISGVFRIVGCCAGTQEYGAVFECYVFLEVGALFVAYGHR